MSKCKMCYILVRAIYRRLAKSSRSQIKYIFAVSQGVNLIQSLLDETARKNNFITK